MLISQSNFEEVKPFLYDFLKVLRIIVFKRKFTVFGGIVRDILSMMEFNAEAEDITLDSFYELVKKEDVVIEDIDVLLTQSFDEAEDNISKFIYIIEMADYIVEFPEKRKIMGTNRTMIEDDQEIYIDSFQIINPVTNNIIIVDFYMTNGITPIIDFDVNNLTYDTNKGFSIILAENNVPNELTPYSQRLNERVFTIMENISSKKCIIYDDFKTSNHLVYNRITKMVSKGYAIQQCDGKIMIGCNDPCNICFEDISNEEVGVSICGMDEHCIHLVCGGLWYDQDKYYKCVICQRNGFD